MGNLNDFLNFLRKTNQSIFIEAEAREDKMANFIKKYNTNYSESINLNSDGICLLGDVDKRGVELRIYFNDLTGIPPYWNSRKYDNKIYRSGKFAYRLDDNELGHFLFSNGYHIGAN
jgi:hypothetical protein